jgi:hypothetical protein
MQSAKSPLDLSRSSAAPTRDSFDRASIDRLGGEPLEGSGFEQEVPDPQFGFDWTHQDEGGLR